MSLHIQDLVSIVQSAKGIFYFWVTSYHTGDFSIYRFRYVAKASTKQFFPPRVYLMNSGKKMDNYNTIEKKNRPRGQKNNNNKIINK